MLPLKSYVICIYLFIKWNVKVNIKIMNLKLKIIFYINLIEKIAHRIQKI